jgi:hypothetical protein
MMGSDGSLSLSEISGLPLPSEPPAKASNATAEAGIDDLIEKLRNLDVGFHFFFVFLNRVYNCNEYPYVRLPSFRTDYHVSWRKQDKTSASPRFVQTSMKKLPVWISLTMI